MAVTSAEPHLVEPTPVVSSPNTLTTTTGFETETSPDVLSPLFPITLPKSTKVINCQFSIPELVLKNLVILKGIARMNAKKEKLLERMNEKKDYCITF